MFYKIKYCLFIAVFCLSLSSFSQIIEGINFTSLSDVSRTFDLSTEDIFGQNFPSENFTYQDEETGFEVNFLTTSKHNNSKIYQTHPQWTYDGKYIVFTSNRTKVNGKNTRQYYAVSTENFKIVQLTSGKSGGMLHLDWKSNYGFQFKDNKLYKINIGAIINDSFANKIKNSNEYFDVIYTLPNNIKPSGIALDSSSNFVYFSSKLDDKTYRIYSLNIQKNTLNKILELPIWIGHIQANPYKEGQLMYCWETRGDSPQRMWLLTKNKHGNFVNKPLYKESKNAWITHEVFFGPDKVLFNKMGHIDRLNEEQTGIMSIDTNTDKVTYLGQQNRGGYWHSNGTSDGKWLIGDTFDGSIYRINSQDYSDTVLLSQGHRYTKSPFSKESHMHQSISPDGKWILFNSSKYTSSDIVLMPLFPEK